MEIYPDVSEWQHTVDNTYNRKFFMYRIATEYGRLDNNLNVNQSWAISARARGALVNFGGYVIPGVSSNQTILNALDTSQIPYDAVVMLDAESWGGLVSGNHSSDFNALAEAIKKRQGGRADLVWGYANTADWKSIWPSPPKWMTYKIMAGYAGQQPTIYGWTFAGWQYTNGTENYTSNPSATAPFGNCDHNVLYLPIPLPDGGLTMAQIDDILTKLNALQQSVNALSDQVKNGFIQTMGEPTHDKTDSIRNLRADVRAAVASLPGAVADATVGKLPTSVTGLSKADVAQMINNTKLSTDTNLP